MFLAWPETDQDKVLAWLRRESERCPGCRTLRGEFARDRSAYVGGFDVCPGCEVLEQERDNVPFGTKGARVFLQPNPKDPDTGQSLRLLAEREGG